MTLTERQLEDLRDAAQTEADACLTTVAGAIRRGVAADRNTQTHAERLEARASELTARAEGYQRRLDQLSVVRVKGEPMTYGRTLTEARSSQHSWLRDLALVEVGKTGKGSVEARQRLDAHARQMAVEKRVSPNLTTGQGGYFVPPIWFDTLWASVPRVERVLSELVTRMEVSSFPGTSVNIPRTLTGTTVTSQVAEGGGVGMVDISDSLLTSSVVTMGGQEDIALQLVEQTPAPGWDAILLADLVAAYDATLETQLINGLGSSNQLLGLLNMTGSNAITYTNGSPAATQIWTPLLAAAGQIAQNRKRWPTAILMTGDRWAWVAAGLDGQNRPLVLPHPPHPTVPGSGPTPVATLAGVPIYVDEAIPVISSQDEVLAVVADDLLLWELDRPGFRVLSEVLSGQLQVRYQLHNYAAWIPTRYPTGVSVITGTGLASQDSTF